MFGSRESGETNTYTRFLRRNGSKNETRHVANEHVRVEDRSTNKFISEETDCMAKKLPLPVFMLNLTIGHWVARLIHVAAKLKLADLLKDGPQTAAHLAAATGVHAPALYRVLRALASVGVFAETRGGRFKLTPL